MTSNSVTVVIPVLNDAAPLRRLLEQLRLSCFFDVVVVDGGSVDESRRVALDYGARLVVTAAGRDRQLRAGAVAARGDWLWFLHADASVTAANVEEFQHISAGNRWGRFDVAFDTPSGLLAVVQAAMNLRSRMTQICTGDQGMFVRREFLECAGGVPSQALMEDIELSRRLRRLGQPYRPESRIGASARRWRDRGTWATILLMWQLRLRYFLGASPDELARRYYA